MVRRESQGSSAGGSRERVWSIPGTRNVRDLGGYPVEGGGTTRWQTLYRGDSLHEVDAGAGRMLAEVGLRSVYDIRDRYELRRKPTRSLPEGIRITNIPLLSKSLDRSAIKNLPQLYRAILDVCGPNTVELLKTIASQEDSLPGMIHCSAGKDRTGVAVAVLLAAIGVPDRHVVEDYTMTNLSLTDEFLDVMRERSVEAGWPPESTEEMLGSPAEAMQEMLEYLSGTYGGARTYLLGHGIDEQSLAELERKMVDR